MLLTYKENVHSTQMYIPLKPLFSRHKGIGVQFTDEPTGNLDSKTTMEVLKLMQKVVREQKQTLVMVTHDNNLATYADRIFKIIDGKIVSIEENHHEVDLVQLEESMQAAAEAQAEGKSKNPAEEEQIETVVEAEEHRIEGKSE